MKFTEIDAPDYATAKTKAKGNLRLRSAVRIAMTVVILIFLGLIYSFPYLARDSAEYYVSVLTLILNGFLFLLVQGRRISPRPHPAVPDWVAPCAGRWALWPDAFRSYPFLQ